MVLIGSPHEIQHFVSDAKNLHIENIISKFWPGPLTLVMSAKKELPSFMKSINNTIALRVPDHEGLLTILKNFKGLFSTSANKSNESIPKTIEEINPEFLEKIFYITNDAASKNKLPSTILDVTSLPFKLIREGAISKKDLKRVLGENIL